MPQKVHLLSEIDPVARKATCSHCGPVSIRPRGTHKGQIAWRCYKGHIEGCRKRNTPDYQRRVRLKHYYGLTPEQYDVMLQKQDGKCAICRSPAGESRLHVDHDHKTGAVRGLLCRTCNVALGHFNDSILTLRSAIEYLERADS